MPVRVADAVCAIVVRDLGEEIFALRRVPRARDATRRVGDHGRPGGDDARTDERGEREQDRRRIAAGVRDDVRRANLVAQVRTRRARPQLGHPIDGIPVGVAGTQVARQVDHASARLPRAVHPRQRRAVWQRAEHDGHTIERHVVGPLERERLAADAHGLPALLVRGREGELEPGMLSDEAAELAPRVSAGAEDAHRDLIHSIMYNHALNGGQRSSPARLWDDRMLRLERKAMTNKQARQAAILDLVAEHVGRQPGGSSTPAARARDGCHSGDTVA